MKKRHRDTKNIGKRRKPSGTGVPPQTTEKAVPMPGLSPALFLSSHKTLFNTLSKVCIAGLTAFPDGERTLP